MQYQERITYHNNPKEKSDIINAKKITINAEKTAINDRGHYAYNDRRYYTDGGATRYYTRMEEPRPQTGDYPDGGAINCSGVGR